MGPLLVLGIALENELTNLSQGILGISALVKCGIGGTTDRERKERGALWKHERIWTSGYHDRISIGPLHPSTKRDRKHEEAGRIKNKRRHVNGQSWNNLGNEVNIALDYNPK